MILAADWTGFVSVGGLIVTAIGSVPVYFQGRKRDDAMAAAQNATTEVDLYGQCASETIDGRYYSSSGGQNDFARGSAYSQGGQGFVVLHSTTSAGESRIVSQLRAGGAVTTPKNTVDKVVTEFGVAELRGRSIRERALALIAIAHPDHRDRLTAEAQAMHYL